MGELGGGRRKEARLRWPDIELSDQMGTTGLPLAVRVRIQASTSDQQQSRHCSPQQSDGVKSVCTHFGANPVYFAGISTRKGGITIAIEAGVPQEILFLQSGHGQTRAARRYMNLVLDNAEELSMKKKTSRQLGRILLKGENITLMMVADGSSH